MKKLIVFIVIIAVLFFGGKYAYKKAEIYLQNKVANTIQNQYGVDISAEVKDLNLSPKQVMDLKKVAEKAKALKDQGQSKKEILQNQELINEAESILGPEATAKLKAKYGIP